MGTLGGTENPPDDNLGNVGEPAGDNSGGDIGGIKIIASESLGGVGKQRKPRSDAGKPRGPRNGGDGSGERKRSAKEGPTLSVTGLESILLGIHATLAAATTTPELQLSQPEAEKLAKAIAAVQQEYPATKIDPKIAVLVQLCGVAGVIYGTRFIAIKMRKRIERGTPQQQQQQQHAPEQPPAPPFTAGQSDSFNPDDFKPFGEEGPAPVGAINFPIVRN